MKIAVVGSRSFQDYALLCAHVPEEATEIISGGAKGADTLAERYADEHGLPKQIFLPRFKTDPSVGYHPSHYHIRNRQIVDAADAVLAFMPPGGSRGTQSALGHAEKTGKPYRIVHFSP